MGSDEATDGVVVAIGSECGIVVVSFVGEEAPGATEGHLGVTSGIGAGDGETLLLAVLVDTCRC